MLFGHHLFNPAVSCLTNVLPSITYTGLQGWFHPSLAELAEHGRGHPGHCPLIASPHWCPAGHPGRRALPPELSPLSPSRVAPPVVWEQAAPLSLPRDAGGHFFLSPTAAVGMPSTGTRGRKGACLSQRSKLESRQLLPALLQQLLSHPRGMGWAGDQPGEDGSRGAEPCRVYCASRPTFQRRESSGCLGLKCQGVRIWKCQFPSLEGGAVGQIPPCSQVSH